MEAQAVRVYLNFDGSKAAFCCPECGQYANLYDRREVRAWRHLDSCQFLTYLVASLPRVSCKQHGILTPAVFWCEPNSRYTALFERFALDVLLATQVQGRAAKLLRLSGEQTAYLMRKAVARGLQRREASEAVAHLGLDEKAFQQGHTYATILTDLDGGRVIDLVIESVDILVDAVDQRMADPSSTGWSRQARSRSLASLPAAPLKRSAISSMRSVVLARG